MKVRGHCPLAAEIRKAKTSFLKKRSKKALVDFVKDLDQEIIKNG